MDETSTGYQRERAHFYDAQMQYAELEDTAFYIDLATGIDGSVLELACGTGRVYLELLQRGVDIDGIDISAAALTLLREKATEQDHSPTVWQTDMTDFDTDRAYDLIICPFNSMQNLLTIEDQLSALQCIHNAMTPTGRFVFDVFVPSFDVVCETYGEESATELMYRDECHEHRSQTRMADEVNQQFVVENELTDSAGDQVFKSEHRFKMLPKREIELLARLSPFSEWRVTGDFDERPISRGDSVQVWTLEH